MLSTPVQVDLEVLSTDCCARPVVPAQGEHHVSGRVPGLEGVAEGLGHALAAVVELPQASQVQVDGRLQRAVQPAQQPALLGVAPWAGAPVEVRRQRSAGAGLVQRDARRGLRECHLLQGRGRRAVVVVTFRHFDLPAFGVASVRLRCRARPTSGVQPVGAFPKARVASTNGRRSP